MKSTGIALALAAACGMCVSNAFAQTNHPEIEPNDTSTQAVANGPFVLASGDTISGDAAGNSDVFLVQTPAAAPGIYRHELVMSMPNLPGYPTDAGIPGLSINWGIAQIGGFVSPYQQNVTVGIPLSIQGGSATAYGTTYMNRVVAWYGFGKQEQLFVSTGPSTATDTHYVLTLTDTAVTTSSPVAILDAGTVTGGVMSIATSATAGNVAGSGATKLWVYDSNFNAIPGYGNHRNASSPTGTSLLVRDFATAGDYYVAIGVAPVSSGLLANDQLEPQDDAILSDQLMPYPNAVAEAYTSYDVGQTLSVVITDGAGVVHPTLTATKTLRAQVMWAKFHVDVSAANTGACCKADGSCAVASIAGCALSAGATFHSAAACGAAGCVQPPLGRCCKNDGACVINSTYACAAIYGQWTAAGTCGSACPSTLTTAAAYGGWGVSSLNTTGSVYFDITANTAVDINALDLSLASPVGTVQTVQVWTRSGSYLGFDNAPDGWTQVGGNLTAVCTGAVPLTHFALPSSVHIEPGETAGFAVGAVVVAGPPQVNTFLRYVDSVEQNAGGIPLGNSNADIVLSTDRTRTTLFGGTTNVPAGFAGRVYYTTPQATVLCCRGSTCAMIAPGACTASGNAGAVQAGGSACNGTGVRNTPCCYADYNKTGGITVQDIFAFLADWFAGSPYAKVGGDGSTGGVTVQDIFSFLAAWFAGGC